MLGAMTEPIQLAEPALEGEKTVPASPDASAEGDSPTPQDEPVAEAPEGATEVVAPLADEATDETPDEATDEATAQDWPTDPPQPGVDPPQDAAEGEAIEEAPAEEETEDQPGVGDQMDDEELVRAVSTLVFASPEPLGVPRLGVLLEKPKPARINAALAEIQKRLGDVGLPLELREIAGGWRLLTSPDQSETVARLVKARKAERLSPAGLETLAVVAYRQPVTKAEIEAIRGVQCGAMLRNLVDRGLARVTGQADVPGHPLQYGTTKEFLDRFGMASLKDLPRDSELLRE